MTDGRQTVDDRPFHSPYLYAVARSDEEGAKAFYEHFDNLRGLVDAEEKAPA
jgi:hypothetical protein